MRKLLLAIVLALMASFVFAPTAQATMSTCKVALVKKTTNATTAQAEAVSRVLDIQVQEGFNQYWSSLNNGCTRVLPTIYTSESQVPSDAWPIFLYHTKQEGNFTLSTFHGHGPWPNYTSRNTPYGWVSDDGGVDPAQNQDYWSSAISHEMLEMLADPAGDGNKLGPGSYVGLEDNVYYRYEVSDPLYGSNYTIKDPNPPYTPFLVADFTIPDYYTAGSKGPWDAGSDNGYALSGPLSTNGASASYIRYYHPWVGTCDITPPAGGEACRYP